MTLRQSSTPWPCSHFRTVISVAGEGWTKSLTCSRDRYCPGKHRGVRSPHRPQGSWGLRDVTAVTVSWGLRVRDSLDKAGKTGSVALPQGEGQLHWVPRIHAASMGPAGGHAVGWAVSEASTGTPARPGPALPTAPDLPERLVPLQLQRQPRGAAPGGRTQRQHGGDPPTPATGSEEHRRWHSRGEPGLTGG